MSKADETFDQLREEKIEAQEEVREAKNRMLRLRTIYRFHQKNLSEYFFFVDEKLEEEYGSEFRVEDVEIHGDKFQYLDLHFNFALEDLKKEGDSRFDFRDKIMKPFFEEFSGKDSWIEFTNNTNWMDRGKYTVNVKFER